MMFELEIQATLSAAHWKAFTTLLPGGKPTSTLISEGRCQNNYPTPIDSLHTSVDFTIIIQHTACNIVFARTSNHA